VLACIRACVRVCVRCRVLRRRGFAGEGGGLAFGGPEKEGPDEEADLRPNDSAALSEAREGAAGLGPAGVADPGGIPCEARRRASREPLQGSLKPLQGSIAEAAARLQRKRRPRVRGWGLSCGLSGQDRTPALIRTPPESPPFIPFSPSTLFRVPALHPSYCNS
jgi:hypothetical protein